MVELYIHSDLKELEKISDADLVAISGETKGAKSPIVDAAIGVIASKMHGEHLPIMLTDTPYSGDDMEYRGGTGEKIIIPKWGFDIATYSYAILPNRVIKTDRMKRFDHIIVLVDSCVHHKETYTIPNFPGALDLHYIPIWAQSVLGLAASAAMNRR
jgi:hypothetical protein